MNIRCTDGTQAIEFECRLFVLHGILYVLRIDIAYGMWYNYLNR